MAILFFLIRAHTETGAYIVPGMRTTICICAAAAVVFVLHTLTNFFSRTVAVVVYSLRFFPHRDSCLPPLLLLLLVRHDNRQPLSTVTRFHVLCYSSTADSAVAVSAAKKDVRVCQNHSSHSIPFYVLCFLPLQLTPTRIFSTVFFFFLPTSGIPGHFSAKISFIMKTSTKHTPEALLLSRLTS